MKLFPLMLEVRVLFDEKRDLVVFTLAGHVRIEDIAEVGDRHFQDHKTNRSLWDLREADLSGITITDMQGLAERSIAASAGREQPKGAIVVNDDGKRALVRLYEVVSERNSSNVVYRIFDNVADATAWLEATE